jgi:hypothetical protein
VTSITLAVPVADYIETEDEANLVTRTRAMERREKKSGSWRELIMYSSFATTLTVLSASIAVLLGF